MYLKLALSIGKLLNLEVYFANTSCKNFEFLPNLFGFISKQKTYALIIKAKFY